MDIRTASLWTLGILVVGIFVLIFGGDEVAWAVSEADSLTLALLCFLQVVTLAMSAYQWYRLLVNLRANISFSHAFVIHLSGAFVESVTPSVKVGGEAAKIYLSRRATGLPGGQLLGAAMAHKYLSLLPFLAILVPVVATSVSTQYLSLWVVYSFLILAFVFALFFRLIHKEGYVRTAPDGSESEHDGLRGAFSAVLRRTVAQVGEAAQYSRYLVSGSERGILLAVSALIWMLYPVKVYLVASMLGLDAGILNVVVSTYSAYVLSMIPLTPGGLGTFEGSMAIMLARGTLTPAEGLAVALLTRLVTFWFPLVLSAGAAATTLWKHVGPANSDES